MMLETGYRLPLGRIGGEGEIIDLVDRKLANMIGGTPDHRGTIVVVGEDIMGRTTLFNRICERIRGNYCGDVNLLRLNVDGLPDESKPEDEVMNWLINQQRELDMDPRANLHGMRVEEAIDIFVGQLEVSRRPVTVIVNGADRKRMGRLLNYFELGLNNLTQRVEYPDATKIYTTE